MVISFAYFDIRDKNITYKNVRDSTGYFEQILETDRRYLHFQKFS